MMQACYNEIETATQSNMFNIERAARPLLKFNRDNTPVTLSMIGFKT